MITVDKIRSLAEVKLQNTGNYIVDIIIKPGNKITVLLDSLKDGIAISDCVDVSRQIESNLDRDKEDFELNVSSAGLDRPFKVLNQYIKNIGKEVEVMTTENERLIGTLLSASEKEIELALKPNKKKKKSNNQNIRSLSGQPTMNNHKLNYNQIKETKIVISF